MPTGVASLSTLPSLHQGNLEEFPVASSGVRLARNPPHTLVGALATDAQNLRRFREFRLVSCGAQIPGSALTFCGQRPVSRLQCLVNSVQDAPTVWDVANQVLLLVGPVAATSALGDRNPDVERTDTRSTSAAMSRVALGGILP